MYLVFKTGKHRKMLSMRLRKVSFFGGFLGIKKTKTVNEIYIKKSKVLIFTGGFGSGKSRELKKIADRCGSLFGVDGVFIPVAEGLDNWFKRAGLSNEDLKGLKQFEKVGKLIEVCKGKVVILDDVDRAGKIKVDAVKWLIRVASVVIVSCQDLNKINDGIEYELRKKLRLKGFQSLNDYIIDLGKQDVEVKDIGVIVGIVLIVFVAFSWGITEGLLGALALRWLTAEGRRF